jgi:phosphate transport system substrate-binding protein
VALDPRSIGAPVTGSASAHDAQTAAGYTWSENLTIFASFSVATLAQTAVGRNHYPGARFKLEPGYDDAATFRTLCRAVPYGAPEVIEVSRRITAEESRYCTRIGLPDIVEVKIAYQAIALARAKVSGPLRLSTRDLFLSLAHQVPDPTQAERLVINPNATWNQVDPALPHDPILVFGPAPGWGTGGLTRELLLEPGCNTYSWIAALRDSDPAGYDNICKGLRADNVYRADMFAGAPGASFGSYPERLVGAPTAIGIFSLEQLDQLKDKLLAIPINGTEPTAANVANGTYPLSRALYIYAIKRRVQGTRTFGMIVRYNMAVPDTRGNGSSWGLTPLPENQRTAVLASVDALQDPSKEQRR